MTLLMRNVHYRETLLRRKYQLAYFSLVNSNTISSSPTNILFCHNSLGIQLTLAQSEVVTPILNLSHILSLFY